MQNAYKLSDIRSRIGDETDKLKDMMGHLESMGITTEFFRAYTSLFVSGIEEALERKWPKDKDCDKPDLVIVSSLNKRIDEDQVVAGYLPDRNWIIMPRSSVYMASMINTGLYSDETYQSKKRMFSEYTILAGMEEALHACQYNSRNRNDEDLIEESKKYGDDITSYQMKPEELAAKEEKESIFEEVREKYEGLLDVLLKTTDF